MKTDTRKQVQFVVMGTYRQAMGSFLIDRRARGLARGTCLYYQVELDLFAGFLDQMGVVQFEEITSDLLRAYLLSLEHKREQGPGRNAGGIHAAYRALRVLLNWFMDEYEPENWKNPILKVKAPRVSKDPKPGVPIEDVLAMIRACNTEQSKRDRAILMMLLDTGVRAAELLAIDLRDVNPVSGEILIRHGKGNKARTVFLGARSRKALRTYLRGRGVVFENDPLFVTDEGDARLKYAGLVKMVKRRAEDAGVPAPGLHDFRRCFAVTMLRAGVDLVRLSHLMGHANLEILRRYLSLCTDDIRLAHAQGSPVDRCGL